MNNKIYEFKAFPNKKFAQVATKEGSCFGCYFQFISCEYEDLECSLDKKYIEITEGKMKITDIRFKDISGEKQENIKLLAMADLTFDGCLVVHNVRLFEGERGFFCSFPSKKVYDGSFKDVVHPLNSEFRDYITKEILKRFLND